MNKNATKYNVAATKKGRPSMIVGDEESKKSFNVVDVTVFDDGGGKGKIISTADIVSFHLQTLKFRIYAEFADEILIFCS